MQESKFFFASFNGSYVRALLAAFPAIGLVLQNFKLLNKKRYFLQLANKLGFDALVPENWYNIAKNYKLPKVNFCCTFFCFLFLFLNFVLVFVGNN
jgi:hypothetical protein